MLEARNITGSRGEKQLFQDLSLNIQPREIVYVRGRNGTGKTTLLKTLCGLARPDQGEILFNNVPVADCETEFRQSLIYIGHENGIKGDLTPLENLKFCHRLAAAPSNLNPTRALERLEASNLANIPSRYLSAGQKRRVALARLLITNARIWLLDEPLTALDEAARNIVSELIANHLEDDGICVATSHQPLDYGRFEVTELVLGGKT